MKELLPIKTEHCNFTYTAPEGMDNCGDLHVYRGDGWSSSTWKIKNIWQRVVFLFTGKMSLIIQGNGMPPVSLFIGDYIADEIKRAKVKQKK